MIYYISACHPFKPTRIYTTKSLQAAHIIAHQYVTYFGMQYAIITADNKTIKIYDRQR